jgi:hypothetical protein
MREVLRHAVHAIRRGMRSGPGGAPEASPRTAPRVPRGPVLLLAGILFLPACASVELVELPVREADLYPTAEIRQGVAVAVDEIVEPGRSERHFGADLAKHGILPVQVLVSNQRSGRISVRPADFLLLQGRAVRDPVPVEHVSAIVRRNLGWAGSRAAEEIDRFLEGLALRETVVAPGETYRAVFFFERPVEEPLWGRRAALLRVSRFFPQPSLQLHIVLTELEEQERLRFGPIRIDG